MNTATATLYTFANTRPGFDLGNYDSYASYRSDYSRTLTHLHDARTLLALIARLSIADDDLIAASVGERLTLTRRDDGAIIADYTTGQYYPVEYRAAVCRVASRALWNYWRDERGLKAADIRKVARRELGRSLANRWFN